MGVGSFNDEKPAQQEAAVIGDAVLVAATLRSGPRTRTGPDGSQVEYLLVQIEGRKKPVKVRRANLYRPSGERYVLTVTDFDPSLPTIARNIRRLRHAQNMTQLDFAHAIGVSQQVVGLWETGKSGMSVGNIDRIAAAFGVSVASLLTDPEARAGEPEKQDPAPSRVRVRHRTNESTADTQAKAGASPRR